MQQIVAQAVRVKRFSGQQIACQLLQKRLRILDVHVGRDLPDKHIPAAEVLRLEPAALQKRFVFQHGRGLFSGKLRRDGCQQQLGHDGVILLFERFKADALVRGMLVEEQNGLALLNDDVGVQRLADDAEGLFRNGKRLLLRLRRFDRLRFRLGSDLDLRFRFDLRLCFLLWKHEGLLHGRRL